MTFGTLYGNVSESNGLYGIGSNVGSTYFEWMIFYDGVTAPVTPLGGSWNFDTNIGTPPTGWTQFFPALPTATMWISMAFIDSRNPTTIIWSTPGLISSPSVYATAYVNTFTQAGTTTVWTLTNNPVTVNNTDVSINGVTQVPGVDYTISGTTLTTTTAAPLNAVILVKYRQALPLSFSADSASIQYVPAGTNAVTTNVQAKLRETLSVKDFGATGNGSNDDTTAIQNCVNAVAALPYGGAVYFPVGNYKITSNITIAWPKLVVLQGAGSKLVNILDYRTSVGTNGAITYDASSHAGGDDAYMSTWTGGFTLTNSINQTVVTGLVITAMGTGKGLYLNGVVGGVIRDVAVHGYETNIYIVDSIGFVIRDVYTNQTNYGIRLAGYSALSGPNAVIIENVIASACNKWGLYINGGMVQVLGGTYSDCGVMATVSGGICQITDASIGLPKTLTVQAAWFERNRGSADVYINNPVGTTTPTSFSVSNSLFARIDSTYHTTNNVYVLNNGNAYLQLDVNNCGFQGYGTSGNTYVANASRKYIAFAGTYSAQCYTSYVANTFNDSTEWPITQVNSVNFSTIGFGSSTGQLIDISGTPTLYANTYAVGLANSTGEIVLDTTSWRPSIPNTFDLGAAAYTFKNAYIAGFTQYGASATTYISNSGVNLDLCNTCGVVPGVGISPKANNAQYLGGSALRWSTLYSVLGNFSGAITWGAYAIPVPTGSTSTFLRNDGTWVSPSIDYSYIGTGTGFTTSPTAVITYTRTGNIVTLNFSNLQGISNSTSFTITGGTTAMRPSVTRRGIVDVEDNGVAKFGAVNIYTTGVIDVYAGAGNLGFTAAGDKGIIECSISYTI